MSEPYTPPPWYLKIPPPIWTLGMLAIVYVSRGFSPWAAAVYAHSLPLAMLFFAMGVAIAAWALLIFADAGTEIEPASRGNKKLVIRGPFRFTRNPMYLGLVLISLGAAFFWGTRPFFAVPVLVFLLCNFVFTPFEEAKMQRQFPDPYTDYRARVQRWL